MKYELKLSYRMMVMDAMEMVEETSKHKTRELAGKHLRRLQKIRKVEKFEIKEVA